MGVMRLFGVTISAPEKKLVASLLPEKKEAGEEEKEKMGRKNESTASLDPLLTGTTSFPMKKDGRCHPADKGLHRTHACKGLTSSRRKTGAKKKGVPWTEEEHKAFLRGLERHGKGDWRAISRHFVLTRTPAQVASHAQKYYLRPASKVINRRTSLFDVRISDEHIHSGVRVKLDVEVKRSIFPCCTCVAWDSEFDLVNSKSLLAEQGASKVIDRCWV